MVDKSKNIMKYYQLIFNLSEESTAITFDHSINISSFELKKINSEEKADLSNTPILFKTDTKDLSLIHI